MVVAMVTGGNNGNNGSEPTVSTAIENPHPSSKPDYCRHQAMAVRECFVLLLVWSMRFVLLLMASSYLVVDLRTWRGDSAAKCHMTASATLMYDTLYLVTRSELEMHKYTLLFLIFWQVCQYDEGI